MKTYHCLFEQSGTFKNEFKKLGYAAEDYDILNDFNQTDHVIDLFAEIEKAYEGQESLFDTFAPGDECLAFFPCIRFEDQIQMAFRGTQHGKESWDLVKKLEYDIYLHKELHELYVLVTKLAIVCLKRKIPLILENPYSTTHYLVKYWCIPYSVLDMDRRQMGDYYMKPTQYWFIGRKPSNNFVFEGVDVKTKKQVHHQNKVDRSMISPDYANRFIREFILPSCDFGSNAQ